MTIESAKYACHLCSCCVCGVNCSGTCIRSCHARECGDACRRIRPPTMLTLEQEQADLFSHCTMC